jgi:hypothetical protein
MENKKRMKNNNVKIKIIEAKDALNERVPKKYKGSLDWGQEVDYILNTEEVKDIIRIENDEYFSDDFITITFNYSEKKEVSNFTAEEWKLIEQLNTDLKENPKEYKEIMDKIKAIKETRKDKTIEEEKGNYIKQIEEINLEIEGLLEDIERIKDNYRINREDRIKASKKNLSKNDYELIRQIKSKIKDKKEYIKELREKKSEVTDQYTIKTDELRFKLYKEGFDIGDKHFVRYKRSSGSARVGKVLFIYQKYYQHMINWSFAGIDIKDKEIDIAGIEAYISLPLSSAINKFKLKPENILLIDDIYSKFTDTVYATELINQKKDNKGNVISGDLFTNKKEKEIKNNIFDGQALLDESIFLELGYEDKADLQLRNRFYKGTGVRCKLQEFFKNNRINSIEQLNGRTTATNISQIKLITTPSSVKYMKFGTLEKWLEVIEKDNWYVCKYEKPQHHFNGMVQTHYQLLNSLGMDREQFKEFLSPTVDYIEKLKNNNDVFLKHIKVKCDGQEDEEGTNYILSLLKWNKNFINSAVVKEFRRDSYESYIKNTRKGHILVNGNYSIVASNVLEMLYHSIGKLVEVDVDGKKILRIHGQDNIKLEGYKVISNKFKDGEEILSVRSPQPTMSNVAVYTNIKNKKDNSYYYFLEKYFYLSDEVVYTNSINVNRMEKASSEDFDGDSELLTNNKILVNNAKKLQDKFWVNNDMTVKTPQLLHYTAENLAMTDIACSKNKIGEIINLAQILNTVYWSSTDKDEEWLEDLFKNISTLNALSCIEIDRCKKISPVDSSKEINKIKKMNYVKSYKLDEENNIGEEAGFRLVKEKPEFLKYCNEFKLNGQTIKADKDEIGTVYYKNFGVGMDLLEELLTEGINAIIPRRTPRTECTKLLLKGSVNKEKENRRKIDNILDELDSKITNIRKIWSCNDEKEIKLLEENEIITKDIETIKDKMTVENIARIIYRCERFLKSRETIISSNKKLEKPDLTEEERAEYIKKIANCQKYIDDNKTCRYYRSIIKILFKTNKAMVLSLFKSVPNDKVLVRVKEKSEDSITLYDVNYILKNIEHKELKVS